MQSVEHRSQSRKGLVRLSYFEGACFAAMVGTAEAYTLVFATQQGITGSQLGLMTQLPVLLGAILTMFLPPLVPTRSLKLFTISAVGLQILGMLLIFLWTFEVSSLALVLSGLICYWAGGQISGPSWLDWMSSWFPDSKIRSFVGRRNAFVMVITLLSFLGASSLFYLYESAFAFRFILIFGLLSRLASLVSFSFHPPPLKRSEKREEFFKLKLTPRDLRDLSFLIFVLFVFHFGLGIASTYFIPYKLVELNLSVPVYVILTAIPFLARGLILQILSSSNFWIYPLTLMSICAFGIAFVPLLYRMATGPSSLIFPEIMGGLLWAGFELSLTLYVFQRFRNKVRLSLGIMTAFNAFGLLLGSLFGGRLLDEGMHYHELFTLSFMGRCVGAFGILTLFWLTSEQKPSLFRSGDFLSSILSIRPSLASIRRLIPVRKIKRP